MDGPERGVGVCRFFHQNEQFLAKISSDIFNHEQIFLKSRLEQERDAQLEDFHLSRADLKSSGFWADLEFHETSDTSNYGKEIEGCISDTC